MTTNTPNKLEIPEGLTPEVENQFKAVMGENAVLKDQVKQIKRTLRGGLTLKYNCGKSGKALSEGETPEFFESIKMGLECADRGNNGKPRSPVKDIRAFCIQCVGGEAKGRKPFKAVRECKVYECPLHPYRMGTNPYRKLNLSEEERKTRAKAAQERFTLKD